MPEEFTLKIELDTGLWIVTSPEIRGLMVADADMHEALSAVVPAMKDLEREARKAEKAPDRAVDFIDDDTHRKITK